MSVHEFHVPFVSFWNSSCIFSSVFDELKLGLVLGAPFLGYARITVEFAKLSFSFSTFLYAKQSITFTFAAVLFSHSYVVVAVEGDRRKFVPYLVVTLA